MKTSVQLLDVQSSPHPNHTTVQLDLQVSFDVAANSNTEEIRAIAKARTEQIRNCLRGRTNLGPSRDRARDRAVERPRRPELRPRPAPAPAPTAATNFAQSIAPSRPQSNVTNPSPDPPPRLYTPADRGIGSKRKAKPTPALPNKALRIQQNNNKVSEVIANAILQGGKHFQANDDYQLAWASDLEKLKPNRSRTKLSDLYNEYDVYADVARQRSCQSSLVTWFLCVGSTGKAGRLQQMPLPDRVRKRRARNAFVGQLLISTLNILALRYGRKAYGMCTALAADPTGWCWGSHAIQSCTVEHVQDISREIASRLEGDQESSWRDIDPKFAIDPAMMITATDLSYNEARIRLGLTAPSSLDENLGASIVSPCPPLPDARSDITPVAIQSYPSGQNVVYAPGGARNSTEVCTAPRLDNIDGRESGLDFVDPSEGLLHTSDVTTHNFNLDGDMGASLTVHPGAFEDLTFSYDNILSAHYEEPGFGAQGTAEDPISSAWDGGLSWINPLSVNFLA